MRDGPTPGTPRYVRPDARACVMILAGLDPSGGAGLIADARAVESTGAWPCPVCTLLTVQSTAGLVRAVPVHTRVVQAQARELFRHQRIRAVKIGALGERSMVRAVTKLVSAHPAVPAVLDPIFAASRSHAASRLLRADARAALIELAAKATILMPNVDEAGWLLGCAALSEQDLEDAAQALLALGPRAVLIKGGHVPGARAVDVLALRNQVLRASAARGAFDDVHGTGCALSSLVAGLLARAPSPLSDAHIVHAVRGAKQTLTRWIHRPAHVGDGSLVMPAARPRA